MRARGRPLVVATAGVLIAVAAASTIRVMSPTGSAPQAAPGAPSTRRQTVTGELRVNQLGYLADEAKTAFLIATQPVDDARFSVLDSGGRVVLEGDIPASRFAWNDRYRAVHALDFSTLDQEGTYRIRIVEPLRATSPSFRIGSAPDLFETPVRDAVAFFQAQRDGPAVIAGDLGRRPSHLNDRTLGVYAWPTYDGPDSDVIVGDSLSRLAGPVDLSGGWFDAGDFIKFTHTTAYSVGLMYASMRHLGARGPAELGRESRFGQAWLERAWDARRGIVYIQVGIGSGNADGTFSGDHDLWRLPEEDDRLAGNENRYLRHRPAFRGNDPGDLLPPNLAGRLAASFALAAQVDAQRAPARAARELEIAAQIFGRAKVRNVREADVVTALPHAFYPESSWRDDLEWAAAELALAGQALGDPRASGWLRAGASWAQRYLANEAGDDTFNLYDVSALAHADLVRAIRVAGHPGGLAVREERLIDDLRAQLGRGVGRAADDPFRAGAVYDDFDAAAHTFGLVVTERLYRDLTGDRSFDAFATEQRSWALGANAWGASLMIGTGSRYPHCPQHVVANLSGSTTGAPPILRGAVVNGPNSEDLFADGLGEFFEEGTTCPADGVDRYEAFTGRGSRFVDDVRSWQTVEPAIDFTAAALLAFALLQ